MRKSTNIYLSYLPLVIYHITKKEGKRFDRRILPVGAWRSSASVEGNPYEATIDESLILYKMLELEA